MARLRGAARSLRRRTSLHRRQRGARARARGGARQHRRPGPGWLPGGGSDPRQRRLRLRRRKPPVGRASVYRALEQLEELGLVQRIEVCRGTAGYERIEASGHHHHHAICRDCGRMVPFEDSSLERAIGKLSEKLSFEVSAHDVVLRGKCERCAG